MLLIPYIIVSNAGEAGIVIEGQKIDVKSLPDDIQDILIQKNDYYNIILLEFPIAEVTKLNGQITKERKLVLSNENQTDGSFVRIEDVTTTVYVTSYNIFNKSFEKLIIGDVKTAGFGVIIEDINNYKMTPILTLSKIDFFGGGLLAVLILTFLLHKMVALWNIPAIISCYSFQVFLANFIAYMNGLELGKITVIFGLLFIPSLPLILKLKAFEETKEGKQSIYELYIKNKKIILNIKNKFIM